MSIALIAVRHWIGVMKMNKKIKYTSKNGYTGVMYGKSSFTILNENGKEVFHTGFRNFNTYEELIEQVDTFSEFYNMILGWLKNGTGGKNDK